MTCKLYIYDKPSLVVDSLDEITDGDPGKMADREAAAEWPEGAEKCRLLACSATTLGDLT